MRDQQTYPPSFVTDILEDWDYNHQGPFVRSMTQFCRDWNVPRSTFQGWLSKATPLPAERFYSPPDTAAEPAVAKFKSIDAVDASTAEVLRMLANELSAVASDLNEIVNKL